MTHLTIYWKTHDKDIMKRIRERFGIAMYMSINGETEADIKDEDLPVLEETERRGFIQIRRKQNQGE